MKRRASGVAKRERASAMTEMALLLPILLLFVLGIMQYGYILAGKISLENTAGILARQALIDPTIADSNTTMTNIVHDAMNGMLGAANLTAINVDKSLTVNGDNAIEFELQYDLPVFFPFVVPSASGGVLSISATSVTKEM